MSDTKQDYERIVIDQEICISCNACVAVCPYQAIEMDENGKVYLIWDKCKDDFSCIKVCPVSCIWKASEAPKEAKMKTGWIKFSRKLTPEEIKKFEAWATKYGINIKGIKF
jgi:ferredoxin